MKIIATIGTHSALCELTLHELNQLRGGTGPLTIGDVVDISKPAQLMNKLKRMDSDRLKVAADHLTDALTSLIETRDQVQALTLFDTLSDD